MAGVKGPVLGRSLGGSFNRLIVLLFFSALLTVGLSIYHDFGAHWDEHHNQIFGRYWAQAVESELGFTEKFPVPIPTGINTDTFSLLEHNRHHGPAYELLLYFSEKLILPDKADFLQTVHLRHLLVFLTWFSGAILMYFLAKRVFHGACRWGLLATLFYLIHPRIFADGFYNSVDVPFMVLYLCSTLTLLRFLEHRNKCTATLHGVVMGMLIDVRIAGVVMVLVTLLVVVQESTSTLKKVGGRKKVLKTWAAPVLAGVTTTLYTVFTFWPMLWKDPAGTFLAALRVGGARDYGPATPWWYNIFWISVTTPTLYLALCLVGASAGLRSIVGRKLPMIPPVAMAYLVPSVVTVVARPFLTDSWRHHYFLWPGIVLLCGAGLKRIFELIGALAEGFGKKAALWCVGGTVAFNLTLTATWMAHMHPNEFVFAGLLAGKNGQRARVNGDSLDYWGVSTLQGLRYIISHDQSSEIQVFLGQLRTNYYLLSPEDRARLKLTSDLSQADYAVIFYRSKEWKSAEGGFSRVYWLASAATEFMGVYRNRDRMVHALTKK